MPLWKQHLLRRLQNPAGDGSDLGGGGAGAGEGEGKGGEGEGKGAEGEGKGGEGGKTGPTDEEARLLKENMKRKEELQRLAKELEGAKGLIKQLEELGGLDQIKELVTKKKTDEEKALEAKGEWERLKARMAEEHQKTVNELMQGKGTIEQQLQAAMGQINELTIGSAFSGSQFLSTETTLTPSKARVIYGPHFDLVDGKVVGYDKPRGAANRTAIVDGYGNPLGFEAAMKKIVEADPEKDFVLKAKTKPGAGSDTKKTDATAKSGESVSSLDKIQAGLKGLNIQLNG